MNTSTKSTKDTQPLYICQNCATAQPLPPLGGLVCRHCANPAGISRIFYKKRTQPTEYRAI